MFSFIHKKLTDLLGTIVILGIIVVMAAVQFFSSLMGQPGPLGVPIIVLIFFVIMLDRAFRAFRVVKDLMQSDIEQLEGRIQLQPVSRNSAQAWIGELKFDISSDQLLALRNGLRYIVYFTPHSRMLAAIEPAQSTEGDDQNVDDLSIELLPHGEKRKHSFRLGEDGELVADPDAQTTRKSKGP